MYVIDLKLAFLIFYFLDIKNTQGSFNHNLFCGNDTQNEYFFFVYLHWRFCYHIFIWDFGWQLIWCIIFMGQIPKYLVLRCTQKNSFWVLVLSMQSGVYDELCYSHKLFFELSEGYYIIILFISCCHFFFNVPQNALHYAKVIVTRGRCNHKVCVIDWNPWDRWKGKVARKWHGPISCQKSQW